MGTRASSADRVSIIDGAARHVTAVGLSGLVAGVLVGGVGGRLFMRAAAAAAPAAAGATTEAGFTVGEITLDGTLSLVLFVGIFVGLVGSLLFVVFRPWLSWAGRWQGIVFGTLLFAVGSATSDVMNRDNPDFVILGNGPLVVTMIVGLFLAYGWLHVSLFRRLDRRLPPAHGRRGWLRAAYYAVTAMGLLVTVGLVPLLLSGDSCDCDPPVVAGLFVVATAIGTALWWPSGNGGTRAPFARWLGYGGLAGAAAFGLARAVGDAIAVMG